MSPKTRRQLERLKRLWDQTNSAARLRFIQYLQQDFDGADREVLAARGTTQGAEVRDETA